MTAHRHPDTAPTRDRAARRPLSPIVQIGFGVAAAVIVWTVSSLALDGGRGRKPTGSGGFAPTSSDTTASPGAAPTNMAWIPGGEFSMGCADPRGRPFGGPDAMRDARPIHRVHVDGFWMDRTEVTNRRFAEFIAATGYVTVAERTPRAEDFPGAPAENLVPGGLV